LHFPSTPDEVVDRGSTRTETLNACHKRRDGSIEPAYFEYAY
jgi:hypothetical protein